MAPFGAARFVTSAPTAQVSADARPGRAKPADDELRLRIVAFQRPAGSTRGLLELSLDAVAGSHRNRQADNLAGRYSYRAAAAKPVLARPTSRANPPTLPAPSAPRDTCTRVACSAASADRRPARCSSAARPFSRGDLVGERQTFAAASPFLAASVPIERHIVIDRRAEAAVVDIAEAERRRRHVPLAASS